MNLFEFENFQPIFNSLGWTLLHFLWQGTLVAILARGAVTLLQKRASNVRYSAMCAALVLMLLAPIVTFSLIYNGGERFLNVDETRLVKNAPEFTAENKVIGDLGIARNLAGSGVEFEQKYGASLFINFEASFPWLVSLWLGGVLILSLRLMVDWFLVKKLREDTVKQLKEWTPVVEKLAKQLGINKSIELLESSLVEVPVAVGWLKPLILLPIGMACSLTPQHLENIIAHELAHIRRHDYLINIFQTIAEILLFYHPAVLWLSKQIRIEREYACDDLAIAACGGDALGYARALTKVEKIRKTVPVLATAATGGSLESRVRRLIDNSYNQRAASGFSGGAILLTISAVAAVGWLMTFPGKSAGLLSKDSAVLLPENLNLTESFNKISAETVSASANVESFPGEDKNLREIALSALGEHHGSVIVLNPHTGRLYTIVNQDLAFREEWHPASTFKIVTSLAALEENKVKADEEISVPDFSESLTLKKALAVSQNDYFETLGKRVGTNRLLAYARRFGLGRRTGVNLPGEIAGKLPQNAFDADAGFLGKYGQEVKMTPMQLAVMVSALANKKFLVRPFAGQPETPPRYLPKLDVSPDSISQIVGGMRSAVEKGTGVGAFNRSFAVAGKTGTAQTDAADIGLFASFAPIENPRFVVIVAIKEPDANGLRAAEIAGEIYRALGSGNYFLKD